MEVVPLGGSREVGRRWPPTRSRRSCARDPGAVLGLATGSSPLPTYAELVRAAPRRHRAVVRRGCACFLLDEYVGLPAGHPQTYRATIARELTDDLGIDATRARAGPGPGRTAGGRAALRGGDPRPPAASTCRCSASAPTGTSPSTSPARRWRPLTRIKTLTDADPRATTRASSARPTRCRGTCSPRASAPSCGPATCCWSPTGAAKAAAVAAAVEGPLTASCPASVLQLHPHASVLLDEAAASGLARRDHYREVYAGKPAWQGL